MDGLCAQEAGPGGGGGAVTQAALRAAARAAARKKERGQVGDFVKKTKGGAVMIR